MRQITLGPFVKNLARQLYGIPVFRNRIKTFTDVDSENEVTVKSHFRLQITELLIEERKLPLILITNNHFASLADCIGCVFCTKVAIYAGTTELLVENSKYVKDKHPPISIYIQNNECIIQPNANVRDHKAQVSNLSAKDKVNKAFIDSLVSTEKIEKPSSSKKRNSSPNIVNTDRKRCRGESDSETEMSVCSRKNLEDDLRLSDSSSSSSSSDDDNTLLPKSSDLDYADEIQQKCASANNLALQEDAHRAIKAAENWVKKLEAHESRIEKWNKHVDRIDKWKKDGEQIKKTLTKVTEAVVAPFSKCSGICKHHCIREARIVESRGRQYKKIKS